MTRDSCYVLALIACCLFSAAELTAAESCSIAGPQAPRDIGLTIGQNAETFPFAPATESMHLCNIHFHQFAEHKASGYSVAAGEGDHSGWACSPPHAQDTGHAAPASGGCAGIAVGDTVEVHWVFTSCDTGPGEGLGNCVSCPEEGRSLRVEARSFLLTTQGTNFADFDYKADSSPAQPNALPSASELVQYLGSTTGPSYDDETCSPYQVSWSVSPSCTSLDINSLHSWCGSNAFSEDHAHGVRKLVTSEKLLSKIK